MSQLVLDCLQVVISTLGPKVEQFAQALISRAVIIVTTILGLKAHQGKVMIQEPLPARYSPLEAEVAEVAVGGVSLSSPILSNNLDQLIADS